MECASKELLENYWNERWQTSDTPWMKDSVNEFLIKYYQKYYPERAPQRVFVPLCGKTLDMIWLAGNGCEVVGVELNKNACEDFFRENNLSYNLTCSGNENILKFMCSSLPITIYNCNIFDAPESDLGKFDFIWDRGSFVAMTKSSRPEYYRLMKELYAKSFCHLIEACIYDESEYGDYPKCLTLKQLEEIVGDDVKVKLVEQVDRLEVARIKHRINFSSFSAVVYLLSD